MIKAADFQPDWVSPPGETIADILIKRKLSLEIFARHMNFSDDSIQELLSGQATITLDLAHKLSQVVGASAAFWMNREELYRQDLKRLENKNIIEQSKMWLQEFPLGDMVKFGWIEKKSNIDEKLEACFKFFGISSIEQWNSRYDRTLSAVAFRTSFAFESKPKSVAAWLRQGELLCHSTKCASWNADKFRQSLSEIRNLTRKKDPAIFVPELQKICAESGVAVAIVRAPNGCRASGATRFISNDKAMLLLSFRYRTDDHFWFSFFHEAAHVLLHGQNGLFIEDADIIRTQEEEEADRFASDIILSSEMRAELSSIPPRFKDVMRFARKAGISHGIVVGQMQHSGLIRREQLNFLKQRFVWEKS